MFYSYKWRIYSTSREMKSCSCFDGCLAWLKRLLNKSGGSKPVGLSPSGGANPHLNESGGKKEGLAAGSTPSSPSSVYTVQPGNDPKKNVVKYMGNVQVCPRCEKVLVGKVISAFDKKWHPACFLCGKCGQQISGGFVTQEGSPWCRSCASTIKGKETVIEVSKKCSVCSKEIKQGVDFSGKSYCFSCFKCSQCKKVINVDQGYLPDGDRALCASCANPSASAGAAAGKALPAGSVCGVCKGVIEGEYCKVGKDVFHQRCFVCSRCKGSLAQGYSQKSKKERVCVSCASK